ncbi:MAG TPA: tRNA pseudouridine(38-40) synthase TruA [Bacteroidales bacterium]|nr:tRNA pseudouridine(38-40) synthase TruA [Bacteroidales bacterium]
MIAPSPQYRYFIRLSYDGTDFCGWQKQENAATVQQEIENALLFIAGLESRVTGCGRTDTGVHARVFYAHFDHFKAFTSKELLKMVYRINSYLPSSIAVQQIFPVIPEAHARFSALSRQYSYYILTEKDPFMADKAWRVHGNIDVETMNRAAIIMMEYTDFECFSKTNTQVKTFNCKITEAIWTKTNDQLIFTIRADRFLRNMVRAIVGTMLDIGRHKTSIEDFRKIIESRNRSKAGYSVPAKGLYLTDVVYPGNIFTEKPVSFLPGSPDEIETHDNADTKFHHRSGNEADE